MNAIEHNADKVIADLKRVLRDSEELLKATEETAEDKALDLRERLSDALEGAKRTCQNLQEKTVAGAKVADRTIRENPYKSIGIALGVGLLVGVLVGRK